MLKQPVGVVKLTNVALVRHRVKGRRFEVACYPNKVVDWRNGLERDLAEVLQSEEIFANAERGELARAGDLRECFDGLARAEIVRLILEKGELQVWRRERETLTENLRNEIVALLARRLVYSENRRLVPSPQIQTALRTIGFQPNINRSALQQTIECARTFEERFNVERAPSLIRMEIASDELERAFADVPIEIQRSANERRTLFLVRPRHFAKFEAESRARELSFEIVEEIYYNNSTRALNENEIFLQTKKSNSPESEQKSSNSKTFPLNDCETEPTRNSQKNSAIGLCATCGGAAVGAAALREHVKSDWHKFNLQAKLRGESAVTADKYEEIRLLIEMSAAKIGKEKRSAKDSK